MPLHIVFVADYGGVIEVSDRLPEPRRMPGHDDYPVPVHQGYTLTRLRVEAELSPVLPDGDITPEEYSDWRAILGEFTEETVDRRLKAVGLAGVCVEAKPEVADFEVLGTALEVTVTNVGPYPAGKMQAEWFGEWEPSGNDPLIGKGFYFDPCGSDPKVLLPGQSRVFILAKEQLRKGLSLAAALPPDKYYLKISATAPGHGAYYEIHRVPAAEMGVDQLEHFLETEGPQ